MTRKSHHDNLSQSLSGVFTVALSAVKSLHARSALRELAHEAWVAANQAGSGGHSTNNRRTQFRVESDSNQETTKQSHSLESHNVPSPSFSDARFKRSPARSPQQISDRHGVAVPAAGHVREHACGHLQYQCRCAFRDGHTHVMAKGAATTADGTVIGRVRI